MNKDYKIDIAGLERHLPLCKLNDDLYIGAFIMLGDVEITVKAAEELLKKAPDFDVIITAECKGIPLAYEMARQSGKDYVVARKEAKLYMKDVVTVSDNSITTAHKQTLCLGGDEREMLSGKKVLIVDDVVSTGGSLKSLQKLVDAVGGNTVGRMFVLAEGDSCKRDDITYLQKLPLFDGEGNPIGVE